MVDNSNKVSKLSFKFSLLSISLVLTSAYALSPSIPQMIKSFPEQSVSSVELLVTVPAFSVMILVLLSSFISKRLGEKLTVCIGLALVAVFGVIPMFVTSYLVVLISRILLGAGFGLINSFAVSLISEFYHGDEKAAMMGFRSAFESLGQSIMTFIAGMLLAFGWKYSALVYLIAVPILLIFYLYIPKNTREKSTDDQSTSVATKQSISAPIWLITVFLFLIVIFYIGMTVRFPLLVTTNHMGTAEATSGTLSIMTFAGMLTGFIFGMIYRLFSKYTLAIGIFCMAISNLIVNFTSSFVIASFGAVLSGVAYAIIVAFTFSLISDVSSPGSATLSTSIVLVGCNLGALLAPYGLKLVSVIFGSHSITLSFIVYGILLLIMGIGSLFIKISRL